MNEQETVSRLEKLGFESASGKLKKLGEKKRKLAIAYEHFRYVRQEKIDAFNKKLMEKTRTPGPYGSLTFQQLSFTPVPPADVLDALEMAIEKNCFDEFEVAHIVTQVKVPDPILFGRITGCPDRFFIAQWDNDVAIEDILSSKEG